MKTKRVYYKLVNAFHGTTVRFLSAYHCDGALAAYHDLLYAQYSCHKDSIGYRVANRKLLRIERILCGSKSCMCGGMIRATV